MRKLLAILVLSILSTSVFAAQIVQIGKNPNFTPVVWQLNTNTPGPIVFKNPVGGTLAIFITVDPTGTDGHNNSPIQVTNCKLGATVTVKPGENITCFTHSAIDFVSFTAADNTIGSTGHYEVEQNK